MEKFSLYSGRDSTGRPLIHLVEPGTRYGLSETGGLDKTASGEHLPEVMELIESISPQPGRQYLVNSALGAGEWVGFNLRGDWFNEAGLTHTPPGWNDIPVWDIDARRQAANQVEEVPGWGPVCWGYPTFYNAHRFRHHVNKDPNKAYGFILGAFYDQRMHRVVLVSELVQDLCETRGALDIYSRIQGGEFPDTSMGAKVPFDICSICGHVARTPAEYDEHVNGQNPEFGMRKILPDGRMCGVFNLYPRFFDDSFVFVGAERSAKVMSNVTSMVRGERPYSQTIYPFTPGAPKLASGLDADEREEEEERLDRVTAQVMSPKPQETFEQKLSKVLSGVPLESDNERKAMGQFAQQAQHTHLVALGRIQEAQAKGMQIMGEEEFEKDIGQPLSDFSYLQKRLGGVHTFAAGAKTAGFGKWAEILKQIPAPTPAQLSFVQSTADRQPSLPETTLDGMAQDPAKSFRAAAQLGIVLRPEEFQYALLGHSDPEAAKGYQERGEVFSATPMEMDASPEFNAGVDFPPEVMEEMKKLLGPALPERSLAPTALRHQISKLTPSAPRSLSQKSDPVLDKISSLYNDYRGGLVAFPPDWRYLSVGAPLPPMFDLGQEAKLAQSTQELSRFLLCLANWPALSVG